MQSLSKEVGPWTRAPNGETFDSNRLPQAALERLQEILLLLLLLGLRGPHVAPHVSAATAQKE